MENKKSHPGITKRIFTVLYHIVCFSLSHTVLLYVGIYIGMNHCHGKTIYYGEETEVVSVPYGEETIFRFDDPVKTISRASLFSIGPTDKNNPDYAVLSVTPRSKKGSSQVTFLLGNGAVVSLKITTIPVSTEKTENFFDFIPKKFLLEKDGHSNSSITDRELIRAMIRGDRIVGMTQRLVDRVVETKKPDLSARLIKIYTGSKFNGYVFKVNNLSKKKRYRFDLQALSLGHPNIAILSQIDKKVLGPGEEGFLRIVSKPTSLYYNINLPVTPLFP